MQAQNTVLRGAASPWASHLLLTDSARRTQLRTQERALSSQPMATLTTGPSSAPPVQRLNCLHTLWRPGMIMASLSREEPEGSLKDRGFHAGKHVGRSAPPLPDEHGHLIHYFPQLLYTLNTLPAIRAKDLQRELGPGALFMRTHSGCNHTCMNSCRPHACSLRRVTSLLGKLSSSEPPTAPQTAGSMALLSPLRQCLTPPAAWPVPTHRSAWPGGGADPGDARTRSACRHPGALCPHQQGRRGRESK